MKSELSKCRLVSIAIGALTLATLGSAKALGDGYTITDLGTLGGSTTFAFGINDSGQVVGLSALDAQPGGDSHAFLWDNGSMTDLGDFGGSNSSANAINNAGEVTGFAENAAGFQHAFLWQNGTLIDLMAGNTTSHGSGWAINESTQVAGHIGPVAFLWEQGVMTLLNPVCATPVRANGINEAGQVAGESGTCPTILWEDDGNPKTNDIRVLGFLPGGLSRARAKAINDVGQVVGDANFAPPDLEDYHAVLWANISWDVSGNFTGDIIDLGALPGGQRSFALAINNHGQVVGSASSVGIGASHAMIWDDVDGMRDLNDLIPPEAGWSLSLARDINDVGQIVGMGLLGGQVRGYLLTPITVCGDGLCEGDEPLSCPQDCSTIPTVSLWGMIVMTSLVLTAATIVFHRFRWVRRG
ncbi:MAG: DUF3466 family protein [Phycisphaerae bacterium]